MLGYEKKQKNLNREQKQAIGLLSIGTFLEYFDLMLYVHMAVLLNELFFPQYDTHVNRLLAAFSFCSTFIFRPLGALLFGWIGDNIGRKSTVIITTILMSFSCIVMANLPTYDQVGASAAWIVTICRIVQGMSSMGERVGAELYLTESVGVPKRFPAVAFVGACANLGLTVALGVATLVTSYSFNWRIAFWVGAGIALIGSAARTTLRETPDFVDAKRRIQETIKDSNIIDVAKIKNNPVWQEKVNKKTAIYYFLIQLAQPVWFYFAYIHCSNILKDSLHYTAEAVIHQNFIISIVEFFVALALTCLCYKFHPLKILKTQLVMFLTFLLFSPLILDNITQGWQILLIQLIVVTFSPSEFPAIPIFYKSFPVFKRFTYASFIYASSRTAMYVISSFGLVYLTERFNNLGLLMIVIPIIIGYSLGISHFKKLEVEAGNYY